MSDLTDALRKDIKDLATVRDVATDPIAERIEKACRIIDAASYYRRDCITMTLTITDNTREPAFEVESVRAMSADQFRALFSRADQANTLTGAVNATANEAITEWMRRTDAAISQEESIGGSN